MKQIFFVLILFLKLCWCSKPNFIVFLADDLGYNDVGVFGSVTISTPNIDRLAIQGMKLTQFYSTAPLCSSSRSALLTGRFPQRSGIYTNKTYPGDLRYRVFYPSSKGSLPSTELTIADYLRNVGYYSKLIGKWHLGHHNALPTERGFDSWYGLPYSHEEGYPGPQPENWVWPPVPLMEDNKIIEQPVNLSSLTSRYTNEAIKFINNMTSMNKPFYLHLAYEQPHIPLFTSPGFNNISRRGLYGDAVQEMDYSIGQIINLIETLHIENNTFVLFTSDNGAWINPSSGSPFDKGQSSDLYAFDGGSNAPNRGGKGSTWEGGVHVPAIVWWPNTIPSSSVCMSPIYNMDILPTLSYLLNFELSLNLTYDGVNIWKYISNKNMCNNRNNDPHEYIYYWRESYLFAVRYMEYKAHFITENGFGLKPPIHHNPPLLYNIEWDYSESIILNTTNNSQYQQILDIIINAKNIHENEIKQDMGYPQYNDQDWLYVPCCRKKFNQTEAKQFANEGQYGLAIWDECVCNLTPNDVDIVDKQLKQFGINWSYMNDKQYDI